MLLDVDEHGTFFKNCKIANCKTVLAVGVKGMVGQ